MVTRNSKFLPESFLGAPRRSPGIPNSDGSFVLYTVSTYSFSNHEQKSEVRLLNTSNSESVLLDSSKDASNPVWVNDETVALLRTTEEDTTELVIGDVRNLKDLFASSTSSVKFYVAGKIEAPADNLKIVELNSDYYAVAITASSNPDGTLYSPKAAKERKKATSSRLYKSLFVRHWDKYVERQRNAIWYGALGKAEDSQNGQPVLTLSALTNALKGTAVESPIPPFGGTDSFDISKSGLILISKDPSSDPARNTKCNFHYVSLTSFLETPKLVTLEMGPIEGAMSSPVFSPTGESAAFLAMTKNGYEADRNQLFYIPDVTKLSEVVHLLSSDDGKGRWDRSPSAVKFSSDGTTLYLTAENVGRKQLWRLSTTVSHADVPEQLTDDGSVSQFYALDDDGSEKLFITSTSLVESSLYATVTIKVDASRDKVKATLGEVSSLTRSGAMFGLSRSQIKEFWFPSSDSESKTQYTVHSWMVVPSSFDASKRYPLAFLVHGGPQSAWSDAWSTRWNPALFAEQGYVVILPNPTGSTGYGQDFTDAIKEQWGGRPYEDLVNCFRALEKMAFVDTDRAVGLGASYGGYMMNWIQGHPLGRRFKALVTHDGVFSTSYQLATDELYFIDHDLGSYNPVDKNYQQWDPSHFMENWRTPHLIIHSDHDYRLSVADGLATFNMLQVRGIESEYLTFPDENHFVLKPENSLVWHETVFNWINRHVGLPSLKDVDDKDVVQDPVRGTVAPVKSVATFRFS